MRNMWELGRDGWILEYMLAGPAVTDYETREQDKDQLKLEAKLRAEIVTPKAETLTASPRLGETALNGCAWWVWAPAEGGIIDVSDFYSTLKRVELLAGAGLWAERDRQVRARVWSYMAAGIYCNGKLAGEIARPVYKPIQYVDVVLPLKAGKNLILASCENLGVRDTRNILGIQILSHREEIRVCLPDERYQEPVARTWEFLRGLRLQEGRLLCPYPAPEGARVLLCPDSPDYEVMRRPAREIPMAGLRETEIPGEIALIEVRAGQEGYELGRRLEFSSRRKPEYPSADMTQEENWERILREIASVESLDRGKFGFPMFNILARKALGIHREEDRRLLFETLDLIERRVDCSDFMLCGLFRYIHQYGMDRELESRVKEVLLDYRYWMDMEGADAMCFWSENHSLMFYSSAVAAGELYPEAYFRRAGMTGRELAGFGRERLGQWLSDVEEHGFEEFLSTVYMCVTFGALLNVIDYGGEPFSSRARAVQDKLAGELCLHAFQGTVIAPMGRVYREVLYPFLQGAQSLINRIDPKAPWAYGEGWLAYMTGSSYEFPAGLKERMEQEAFCRYETGNALVVLEKTKHYCLTSVESPRREPFKRWENIRRETGEARFTHAFTKSLNECFHGTSCFVPGVYGYQQHMWYGALSPEAVVFTNHPGSASERSGMRPGYWNGNGVMPAIRQEKGRLGVIYRIPQEHPVHFTHLYCPKERFDRYQERGKWIFLKKNGGYMGIWCSGVMEPWDDMIFGCERRCYGDEMAYFCVMGDEERSGSLEDFAGYAQELGPRFDSETGRLETKDGFGMEYQAGQDDTQYLL